jgi:Flp pilus assembly protein TadG
MGARFNPIAPWNPPVIRTGTFAASIGRARRGAAAVEMAFLAPILVFMAAGMIDFGLGVYTKMMVADAAQAGAAYAQLNAKNYGQTPCLSNTSPVCAWDQSIQSAATRSHSTGTMFSSAVSATATVLFCCIVNGAVDRDNCTQPPATPPACNPTAGTYVQVATSATLNTLLPYNFAGQLFSFTIPNPLTLQANYLVRIQ